MDNVFQSGNTDKQLPYHKHTGIDSPKINYNDLENLPSAGSPGGSDTEVQFNDNGSFGGMNVSGVTSVLSFDKTTGVITTNGDGGDFNMIGASAAASSNGNGTNQVFGAGAGDGSGDGGTLTLSGGDAGASGGDAGDIEMITGASAGGVPGAIHAFGQYYSGKKTLTDSSTIALNWKDGNVQYVVLGGNRTFTFANPRDGARYLIILKQDGTGSRTVTWPATVLWTGGSAPTLTTTANKVDIVTFVYDGTNSKYYGVASLNF